MVTLVRTALRLVRPRRVMPSMLLLSGLLELVAVVGLGRAVLGPVDPAREVLGLVDLGLVDLGLGLGGGLRLGRLPGGGLLGGGGR